MLKINDPIASSPKKTAPMAPPITFKISFILLFID